MPEKSRRRIYLSIELVLDLPGDVEAMGNDDVGRQGVETD
jgi:hypothetical protein